MLDDFFELVSILADLLSSIAPGLDTISSTRDEGEEQQKDEVYTEHESNN